MKRLPPYGRAAIAHPDRHLLGFWIYTGKTAWSDAREAQAPVLVLPDNESPDEFTWPVKGFTALIIRTSSLDGAVQTKLARALLEAGASNVVAIRSGHMLDFYAGERHAA